MKCIYSSKGHGENEINSPQQHIYKINSSSETIHKIPGEHEGYLHDANKMSISMFLPLSLTVNKWTIDAREMKVKRETLVPRIRMMDI